jgi:hypothetical protein
MFYTPYKMAASTGEKRIAITPYKYLVLRLLQTLL